MSKVADQNAARRFVEQGITDRSKRFYWDEDDVAITNLVHPEVVVRLTGTDGNAFAILGAVTRALARAGVAKAERDAFLAEATSGTYDNLLATAMRWVTVS